MRQHRRTLQVVGGVLITLAALTALAACSGSGSGSMAGDASGGSAAAPADSARVTAGTRKAVGAERAVVRTTSAIRTGEISLTGRHLERLRADVTKLLTALGGTLESEHTTNDLRGDVAESTLVLRIPVAKFEAAKRALEKLGRLRFSNESAKDVTTEVIDVDERVQTLRNSLDRLQRFQRSATDVADLLRYENQIAERQSELQSIEGQQAYLGDQTAMSTITLHLSGPNNPVSQPGVLDDAGFLSGLRGGWHALQNVVVIALTVAGAALPFLAALAVLGWPAWLVLRGLWRRRATASPADS
jgi:hypothetical protein